MKKWFTTILAAALIILIVFQWELIEELRSENLTYFTEELIPEYGIWLLLLTIPLLIAQNIFTVFPVIVIIIIHMLAFNFAQAFLLSFIGVMAGSTLCFLLARSWSENKVKQFWNRQGTRWVRLASLIDKHALPVMVVLRSIPIMPSNVISVAAAVTPMNFKTYFFATVLGNISMVWVLSLLSFPIWNTQEQSFFFFLLLYFLFLLIVVLGFFLKGKLYPEEEA
ncbi:TVP38/TMEM64 family protein [Alkalicoccus daliensis]|uniref:TVP38/TMEM64 family membrane protein n=1 Tax=Alkalicoccus daliensis TaxID=745820 RepID=A0A1H0AG62_9BACI|nr:VTT domain-containing protein [Alkalicoccus daliensis]SDN31756.1 Uncharacterized membrane protein YdjX, TVP38/TMEM64 family, SNARE-associated domain [Alkalicoccus daliensis]